MKRLLMLRRVMAPTAVLLTGLAMHATPLHCEAVTVVPLATPVVVVPRIVAPVLEPVTVVALARPQWWRWLLAFGGAAAEALLGLLLPGAIARVLGATGVHDFLYLGGVLIVRAGLAFVAGSMVRTACEKLAEAMRSAVYGAMLSRDVADYDDGSAMERWTLLNNDVREYKAAAGKLVTEGVPAAVTVIGGTVMLYSASPSLTLLLGVSAPLVLGGGAWLARHLHARLQRVREREASSVSEAAEVLQHIRTVRINATEPEELARHRARLSRMTDEYSVLHHYLAAFHAGSSLAVVGITSGVLFINHLLSGGQPPLGSTQALTAYLMSALRVEGAVASMSQLTSEALRVLPTCGARILECINHTPRIPLHGGKILPAGRGGLGIEWHNVVFGYRSDTPVLRNFSLHVRPGESVALVGRSGAGKSTVMSLLLRLYDVDSGAILLGDVPLTELDARHMRRHVLGVVEQRPTLRPGTVRDNILYGCDAVAVSADAVERAARMAFAHDFIVALPLGYDTPVTDSTLSGGQLQRLEIARALVKNPDILVMDEPTSSLDSESEDAIQRCIGAVAAAGKAVIVIAHKASTVRACSRVVVMHEGAVVQSGSPDALSREPGLYRDLFVKQRDAYET